MSLDVVRDLNWLAIVVATAVYYGVAALSFADPVFGREWRRSIGWDNEARERLGIAYYVGPLLTCLVSVISVGTLAEATRSDSLCEGLLLGIVVGVGLARAVLFVTGALDPKRPAPVLWFAITGGYHFTGLLIAAVLTAMW
jgi:hypothetical protein